jgi:proteasome lid subunit RPN8/RPN11
MFEAHRDMHSHGLDLLAIYHSHPTSEPVPSRTDLERNYSEAVMNLIISLKSAPLVRGWWLGADAFQGAAWEFVAD